MFTITKPPPSAVALVICGVAPSLGFTSGAFGQVPSVLSGGPPVQVRPYVPEPGVPMLTITPGTANPFTGADASGGGGPGSGSGDTSVSGGNMGATDALNTMIGTPWGITAVSNAQAMGLNPSALAATCVLESSCQNVSGGTYTGAFQMGTAAYNEGIAVAESIDPALASQLVSGDGRGDPTSAAIAAGGYLLQGAQALQNAGISDPTVLDVRSYFNFGPAAGPQMAQASSSDPMSTYLSAAAMQGNGITANETVGQWRASIGTKIGGAANQSVFSS